MMVMERHYKKMVEYEQLDIMYKVYILNYILDLFKSMKIL